MRWPVLYICTFLCLFTALPVGAQNTIPYDSICCVPYKDRAHWLQSMTVRLVEAKDQLKAAREIEDIKRYAASKNSEEFRLEARLLEVTYLQRNRPGEKDKLLNLLEDGIVGAKKARLSALAVRLMNIRQLYYNKLADYPRKFATLTEMEQLLETLTDDDIYDKAYYYVHIANAYYPFQEYRTVMQRLQTILSWNNPVNQRTAFGIWHAHNTMGLCYRKLNMPDSSDYYFEKIRDDPYIKTHEPHLYALASGNLGINRYMRGEYETALPLLRIDIDGSIRAVDYNHAVGSMTPLADILLQQGHYKEAKNVLDSIGNYISSYPLDLVDRRVGYYPILARWYQATGQPERAAVAFDSALTAQRAFDDRYNQLKISMFEQKLKISDYQAELARNKTREREYRLYALITAIVLVAAAVYGRMTYLKNQRIKNLQLLEAQQKLEISTLKLNEHIQNLIAKNREIESLQEKVKAGEEWDRVNDLKSVTLITDTDWDHFRHSFERVYAGFTHRMHTRYPQLSTAEQRLLMLIKLQLGPREMALMLGISPESVRIAHYRLRQKLGVSGKQELKEVVEGISSE